MNSLPLISHRLFAAAIGGPARGQGKPVRRNDFNLDSGTPYRSALRRPRSGTVIPLEVVADTEYLPVANRHSSQISALAGA